jgi:16S rRNA (guanine966-N2)-methyltransferase
VQTSLAALLEAGWIAPGAVIVAEIGPDDPVPAAPILAERAHGKARLLFWKTPS